MYVFGYFFQQILASLLHHVRITLHVQTVRLVFMLVLVELVTREPIAKMNVSILGFVSSGFQLFVESLIVNFVKRNVISQKLCLIYSNTSTYVHNVYTNTYNLHVGKVHHKVLKLNVYSFRYNLLSRHLNVYMCFFLQFHVY